jgi:hypothetical protein
MQTSVDGIFACGNVVHVHDLVDYVSMEGARAGECAAKYILGHEPVKGDVIPVVAGDGIRYTVPQKIELNTEQEKVKLFFRVTDVFRDIVIVVKLDDRIILKRKKVKAAPGEMESLEVSVALLRSVPNPQKLCIELEMTREGS